MEWCKKIRKAFLNLEFKKFKDLSLEEQKKVVYHCYNEYLETLDTAQEYKNALHKIYASLQRRDDVFFNPYTLEKRTYKIMKMGLPLGEIKKENHSINAYHQERFMLFPKSWRKGKCSIVPLSGRTAKVRSRCREKTVTLLHTLSTRTEIISVE